MKPELEIEDLRDQQMHIKGLVRRLDDRIERVAEAIRSGDIEAEMPKASVPAPPAPVPPPASAASAPSPLYVPPGKLAMPPPPAPPPPLAPAAEPSPAPEEDRSPARETLEIHFGRVWLVRIGIVVLLTGLVFLGNLAYQKIVPMMGPGGKLTAIGLAGGVLCAIGFRLEKSREALRNYARVLIAGGCATLYYTAYAAHFVSALQVIESALAGGILLLALAGGIVWFAHRKKSEPLAVLAVLLTYYVSGINPVGGFTLYSSLLLTASAVFLLVKNRWLRLSFVSMAGSYASYGWWRFYHSGEASGSLEMQMCFLAGYWIVFTAGAFLAARAAFPAKGRISFITVNNGAFFLLGAYEFQTFASSRFWLFSVIFGLVLLGLNILRERLHRDHEDMAGPMFAQGIALFTLGLAVRLTGYQLALALAAQSLVLLSGSRRATLLQRGASGLSTVAAGVIALCGLELHSVHAELTGGCVALVLVFHGWWAKQQTGYAKDEFSASLLFTGMALGLGAISVHLAAGTPDSASWFALGAVLCAAVGALLRFRELAVLGQILLPMALAIWAPTESTALLPPLAILGAGIGLALWWPRQQRLSGPGFGGLLVEGLVLEGSAALCAAGAGTIWAEQTWNHPGLMAISAGLGGLWIAHAIFIRSRMLAAAGLTFIGLAIARFAIDFQDASWLVSLCPSLVLVAIGAMTHWTKRLGDRAFELARAARPSFYATALVLLLPWSLQHIPDPWLVFFYAAIASGCALGSIRQPALVWYAIGLAFLADSQLVFRFSSAPTALHLVAILLFPFCCRIARRFGKQEGLHETAPVLAWVTTGLLALWLGHANTHYEWNLSPTVLWALLGPVVLAAGFALHDKPYRHGGLLLLILGIGNLFFNDVWRLDPTSRIVSFIVLGIVLLLMGYFYNRFEEKLRRWL